jgi:hypothetical protein
MKRLRMRRIEQMTSTGRASRIVVDEVAFRACCDKLRWALVEIVDGLRGQQTRLKELRWGSSEIPLDLDLALDDRPPIEIVDEILVTAKRFLGVDARCFTGGGALVFEREVVPQRGTRSSHSALG